MMKKINNNNKIFTAMKYVIYDLISKKMFTGSDLLGIYFSSENRAYVFDTKEDAQKRIKEDSELFPKHLTNKILTILEINYLNQ